MKRVVLRERDESGMSLGVLAVLAAPVVGLFIVLMGNSVMMQYAAQEVKNVVDQSLIQGSQYTFRSQGTIQPNCAAGAAIASYALNRQTGTFIIQNNSTIRAGYPLDAEPNLGYSAIDDRHYSDGLPEVFADKKAMQLNALYGYRDMTPLACSYSAVPLNATTIDDYPLFDSSNPMRKLDEASGHVKTVKSGSFYIHGIKVESAQYKDDNTLAAPSKLSMCVTEWVQQPFNIFGFLSTTNGIKPITACSSAELKVGME